MQPPIPTTPHTPSPPPAADAILHRIPDEKFAATFPRLIYHCLPEQLSLAPAKLLASEIPTRIVILKIEWFVGARRGRIFSLRAKLIDAVSLPGWLILGRYCKREKRCDQPKIQPLLAGIFKAS